MRFVLGEAFECIVDRRQAVIAEIRDEGRAGRLRFLDNGQQRWVLWAEFHNMGQWLPIGMKVVQPMEARETHTHRSLNEHR